MLDRGALVLGWTNLPANGGDADYSIRILFAVTHGGVGNDTLVVGSGRDFFLGPGGADTVSGDGEDDVLSGDDGDDLLDGGDGNDDVDGGAGNDVLDGGAGNDTLAGGSGDRLWGEDGNDVLDGGAGADRMSGGAGNDSYFVESAGDQVIETGGNDTVYSSISYTLGENAVDGRGDLENLRLLGTESINATGNGLNNLLVGNDGNNVLDGSAGADTLWAAAGNDTLIGGTGRDTMAGGSGSDTFIFIGTHFGGATMESADIIRDFRGAEADLIDLSGVDANSALSGDQMFAFIGTSAFTGSAGQLRYEQVSGNTYVSGDFDGDGLADFMVRLDGLHTLANVDFLL